MAARKRCNEQTAERLEDRHVDEQDLLLVLLGIDAVYGEAAEYSPGPHTETTSYAANPW